MRIADAAYAAEDVIESYIVNTIQLSRSSWNRLFNCYRGYNKEDSYWNNFCRDLHKVIEEMDRIKEVVMEMMRKKTAVQADEPQRSNIFRSSSLTGKNSTIMMVGADDVFLQLLEKVVGGTLAHQVIPITRMAGIGKTTLARKLFENALVKETFDVCAWVTISQQYNIRDIFLKILSQLTRKSEEELGQEFLIEKDLGVEVHKYLFGRKYLIIIDDIWSAEAWEEMKSYFGDCNNGSRIVVTTRQSYLTSYFTDSYALDMKFLDEDSSWNLFSQTIFRKDSFPLQLEKVGKKIVENCRGLPLSIVVIGGLLAKSKHSQEHWESIEEKLNSIVNSENDEYCLKVLKLSYDNLPAYLKPSFLYMGIFEEDKRIYVSYLIKLWVSEGFLKPEKGKTLEMIGKGFLKDLIGRNLILIDELGSTGNIKYCKIHDLLRDFCLKQAEKERFYHMIGKHGPQGIYNQRRMFCHQRISYDDLKSVYHLRSFTSQYHKVGEFSNFRLLRILNSGMFSEKFPKYYLKDVIKDVIDELVNSRYLAIYTTQWKTKFPSSLSFLWSLQTLRIDHEDGKIMVPVEIWMMSQLRHVEFFMGNVYLPEPPSGNRVILENLQTLRGVKNFKCGEEVVKRIPNIQRLRIVYEEVPKMGRHDVDYYCLNNIGCLRKLKSLTVTTCCCMQNLTFPHSLEKFVLRYCFAIELEEMLEKIGSLPLLQKLRLFGGHFRSGKWKTVEGHFPSLKSLSLMFCENWTEWTIEESSHFPCLEHLRLCYIKELKEIPLEIGEITTLQSIVLVDCSESTVKSAKKMVEEQEEQQGEHLPFHVRVEVLKEEEALRSLANPNFQVKVLS